MKAFNTDRNTYILTAVTAAALGLGAVGSAHAGEAKAFSSLIIDNFQLFDDATGNQIQLGDFDFIDAGDNVTVSANLDGGNDGDSDFRQLPPAPLGIADPDMACVGECGGISQNDFTQQEPLFGHFSRSDAFLQGAIIGGTGDPNEATSEHVSEVQLDVDPGDSSIGQTDSRISNLSEFEFELNDDRQLRFDFTAAALLHLILQNTDDFFVDAGRTFQIAIDNQDTGDNVFSWVPNEGISGGVETTAAFNLQRDISRLTAGETGPFSESGAFSATTNTLVGDTRYNLTISSSTFADASVEQPVEDMPEPGSLGLLGIGLVGMAGALYRRRRSAA